MDGFFGSLDLLAERGELLAALFVIILKLVVAFADLCVKSADLLFLGRDDLGLLHDSGFVGGFGGKAFLHHTFYVLL